MSRVVVWFSCGAASFACAYLMRGIMHELVYCDTGGEHPDNKRFMLDAERYLGKKVTIIRNEKYKDHMDVCEKTGWVNGVGGARCTVELKKFPRFQFQEPDDVQIFGYTVDERHRAEKFMKAYPEVNAKFPLIENNLTKENCLGILSEIGIEIPAMYKLGFNNNNCIGCVKGGMGYWNHVRKHFPDQFKRMAEIERKVGHSCIKNIYLDELKEGRGDAMIEKEISCDFICQSVMDE